MNRFHSLTVTGQGQGAEALPPFRPPAGKGLSLFQR